MTTLLYVFGISLVSCLILSPLVRALAKRWDLVDRPDGRRKVHSQATPLGGGLAIFASAVIAVVFAWAASPLHDRLEGNGVWLIGLLVASALISGVGLVDDYHRLRGKYKLCWQILAVAIVIGCGVQVRSIQFFELRLELGLLAVPFTAFLLLGAINSLNLIDGMDGLLSCVGFIICLAMTAMAVHSGGWSSACVAVALAGALLGFLRYNFPPASIFMGDCGSMVVGLVIGVLAIQSSLKGPATVALAAPLAVLTLPIFDTLAAIVRRKLTGRSFYTTDRGHLHHCMLRRGLTSRRVLGWVTALSLLTLAGALASVTLHNELLAIISAVAVVSILVATRLFGFAEFLLIRDHLRASAGALYRGAKLQNPARLEVHLQGTADWKRLWRELIAFAEEHVLSSMCLDVNAPAIQESFHARWNDGDHDPDDFDLWRVQLPLVASGHAVGRLEIAGRRDDESTSLKIFNLAKIIEDLELTTGTLATRHLVQPARSAEAGADNPNAETDAVGWTAMRQRAVTVQRSNGHDSNGELEPDADIAEGDLPRKPR